MTKLTKDFSLNLLFSFLDPPARPRSRDELDGPRGPLPSQLSTATGTSSILQKQYSNKIIRQRSKRQSVAKMGWEAIRQSVRVSSLVSLP